MRAVLSLALFVCAVLPLSAQVQDVPRDHWAYAAVEELANDGYVLGYPDGSFLGDRTLTRYEFATIVKRVLDKLDVRLASMKRDSQQDLEKIDKLVNEFKVELTIIGARLDKAEAALEQMRAILETHEAILRDEEGALKSTQADVARLKKVRISGYLQARYELSNYADENKAQDQAVQTFLIRRARTKFTFMPTERTTAVLQLELAKNSSGVKDAYLNYALGENKAVTPSFQIGQQNWWFGYEVPYSSSKRETPERSLVARRFFPGERDQGAVIFAPSESKFQWIVGAYNGTGTEEGSYQDLNDAKDALVRLRWLGQSLDFGVSGYRGRGVWQEFGNSATYLSGVPRIRYGADVQYYLHNLTLKAEYMRGKGFDQAAPAWNQDDYSSGYYAQAAYNLSTANTLVAKYSSLSEDPVSPQYGRRSAWDLGVIRWLDQNTRLKLFYQINQEQLNSFENNSWAAECIVTY